MATVAEYRPQLNWVEQDASVLLGSVGQVINEAMQMLGPRASYVVSAGLATQRSSIVCWDRISGTPLSPVISWQDRRTHAWVAQFNAHASSIHDLTGLFLSPHYGASKMHWCLTQLPEVQAAYREGRLCIAPLASFLLFHLLKGAPFFIDPANATRTLLWSHRRVDWDEELLQLFQVPRDCLPTCVSTVYPYGQLAWDRGVLPLYITTGDQSAALFGNGEPDMGCVYINLGTGAFLQCPTPGYPGVYPALLTSVAAQRGEQMMYVIEATVNGAGSAIAWFEREYAVSNLQAQLPEWLAQAGVAPGSPPLFLNGISGLGSPFWVPDFPSRFVGDGALWQQAVAVIESIVFLLQANLEEMQRVGVNLTQLRVSGGLARLDGLCQRLADISGLSVSRAAEPEATARGVAFLLAGSPTAWGDSSAGSEFMPQIDMALTQRYRSWRVALNQALTALKKI